MQDAEANGYAAIGQFSIEGVYFVEVTNKKGAPNTVTYSENVKEGLKATVVACEGKKSEGYETEFCGDPTYGYA